MRERYRKMSYNKKIFFIDVSFSLRMSSQTSLMNDYNTTTSVIVHRSCNTSQQVLVSGTIIISRRAHSVAVLGKPSCIVLQFTVTPKAKWFNGMYALHNGFIRRIYLLWRFILTTPLSHCKRVSLFSLPQRAIWLNSWPIEMAREND